MLYCRLKDKKAAIGYTYEDSTEGGKDEDSEESESGEEEDIETFDLGGQPFNLATALRPEANKFTGIPAKTSQNTRPTDQLIFASLCLHSLRSSTS